MSEDLHFDHGGLEEICVARWPDGASVWRTEVRSAGKGPRSGVTGVFRFRPAERPPHDLTTTRVLEQLGHSVWFSTSREDPRQLYETSGDPGDWDLAVPYLRWLFDRLDLLPLGMGPLWKPRTHTYSTPLPRFTDVDPWICRFRTRPGDEDPMEVVWEDAAQVDEDLQGLHPHESIDYSIGYLDPKHQHLVDEDAMVKISRTRWIDDRYKERGFWKVAIYRWSGTGALQSRTYQIVAESTFERQSGLRHRQEEKVFDDLFPAADIVHWLSDLEAHPTWVVWTDRQAREWATEHSIPGELSIGDEHELYRAVGGPSPYLWPSETLVPWALERWAP